MISSLNSYDKPYSRSNNSSSNNSVELLASSPPSIPTSSSSLSRRRQTATDAPLDDDSFEKSSSSTSSPTVPRPMVSSDPQDDWQYFVDKLMEPTGRTSVILSKRLKKMVMNGIPTSYRGKVWCALSGVHNKIADSNRYYSKLHRDKNFLESVVSQNIREQLDLDVPRTFSTQRRFQTPEGMRSLRRVLLAFAYFNPVIGYCQGLGFLCGALLAHMEEESAFWALVTLIQEILPADYYTQSMIGFHSDQSVFQDLIDEHIPALGEHFRKIGMTTTDFSSQWFLCLYLKVLPFEAAMRVWDIMWFGGSRNQGKILFLIGLALLKSHQRELIAVETVPEAAAVLSALSRREVDIDKVLRLAYSSKISKVVLQQERLKYRIQSMKLTK